MKVFRAYKYAWKYIGEVTAKDLQEALKIAKNKYPGIDLVISDGENTKCYNVNSI